MAQSGVQMYKTRIRVENSIFEPVLTAEEFEDVRSRGKESAIVQIFRSRDVVSTVIGNFKYPVEILSVTPVNPSVPGPGGEGMDQPQAMEFESNGEQDVIQFDSYKDFLKYCYNSLRGSGKLKEIMDKVKAQPKTKPFDYSYNTQEGAVLFNLHAYDLIDEISLLLDELNKSKMPLWQQMRSIKILSAVLAEDVMSNGTKINLDPEEIEWPCGTITKPPANEKKGKGGRKKKNPTSKHGVCGRIVHEYGPRATLSKNDISSDTVVVNKDAVNVTPEASTSCRNGKWDYPEQSDLMIAFKNMLLSGLKRDNYKELSKRMSDMGWDCSNDQCRHEILHLQERYDKMVEAGKQTGGVFYFEPLRAELTDTFTAMSNVAPDCVFSSRKGHENNPNSAQEEGDEEPAGNSSTQPSDGSEKDKKKNNKSRQPVVQQMKLVMDDIKEEFKLQDDKMESKIDCLIQLLRERVNLEKERLRFDRERLQLERVKAGLPCLTDEGAYFNSNS